MMYTPHAHTPHAQVKALEQARAARLADEVKAADKAARVKENQPLQGEQIHSSCFDLPVCAVYGIIVWYEAKVAREGQQGEQILSLLLCVTLIKQSPPRGNKVSRYTLWSSCLNFCLWCEPCV